ncbi:hypothetical protein [Pseudonocardia nigra]|uniref:hypothetical protein n=1 Tax=Pseudonocardia nigra TaxID=1921578 RepID=UPI002484BFF7|nr:hypothetical protein [Pseudonocardia nigra]
MRPTAGSNSGKKISLKTMAAASEYSWKSMNSIAVPSQPDTAALLRSPVVLVAAPGGAGVLFVIVAPLRGDRVPAVCGFGGRGRSGRRHQSWTEPSSLRATGR